MKYVLCDIDGCCADPGLRHHLYEEDYAQYRAMHFLDAPIEAGVEVYRGLMNNPDLKIVFITSRSEDQRPETSILLERLFSDLGADYDLWMRPMDVDLHCADLKKNLLLKNLSPSEVLLAFDDLDSTVAMYRSLGIVAYQTADGIPTVPKAIQP